MLTALTQLLLLQHHDQQIQTLQHQANFLPKERDRLQKQILNQQETIQLKKTETQKIETSRKKIDLDVQSQQQHILKLRTQMQQTRKNEEYNALSHEIDQAQKIIANLEDQELERMEEYEKALKLWQHEAETLKLRENDFQQQILQIESQLKTVEQELTKQLAERLSFLTGIPEDILARYERLLPMKGNALAPLEHGNVCGGCHLTVMSQTALDCKSTNKFVNCENCGRFLYWPV